MSQKCLKFYSPANSGFDHSLLTKRLATFIGEKSPPDIEEEACYYVIVEHDRYAEKLLDGENTHLVSLICILSAHKPFLDLAPLTQCLCALLIY